MIYSLRGAAFTMVALAMFGTYSAVNRSMNWSSATATISYIDRSCNFTEELRQGDKLVSSKKVTDSCGSTDEFAKIRKNRSKLISGRATVHVTYTAPQNGSYQTGEFKLTGRDDAFYELGAGDPVRILVSKTDPEVIRKA